MIKSKIIIIFLFSSVLLLGQKFNSTVTTENSEIIVNLELKKEKYRDKKIGQFILRDYYEHTNLSEPNDYKLPSQQILVAIPPNTKPQIEVIEESKIRYEKVLPVLNSYENDQSKDDGLYNYSKVSTSAKLLPKVKINGTFWVRDFYCLSITIYSHSFDEVNNVIQELKNIKFRIKFDNSNNILKSSPIIESNFYDKNLSSLIINPSIAEQFRAKSHPSIHNNNDNWIDYGNEYVKLLIDEDGIYRITYEDLISYGVDPTIINSQKIKIIRNGNEVPLYFSGDKSLEFKNTDYVEFYGKRNYSLTSYREINNLDEPYNEFLNRYSASSVYWLNWSGSDGKRIIVQSNFNSTISDTIKQYLYRKHYEQNNYLDYSENNIVSEQDPHWQSTETWFWGLQSPGTKSLNFNVNNIQPNTNLNIDVKIYGFASNVLEKPHSVSLQINDKPEYYDSKYLNRFEQTILNLNLEVDLLNDGVNQLKLVSFETDAFPNSIALDWFDVEYSRSLLLTNDSLKFEFKKSLAEKEYIVELNSSTTNNLILYKTGANFKKIENTFLVGSKLYFSDTIKGGDEYLIQKETSIKKPQFQYKKIFENILTEKSESKYLLLTHSSLINKANDYVDFISTNYNISALALDVNDIYDQFNFGLLSPESIKNFLQIAYTTWIDNRPEYLFLVGEANYDFHNNLKIADYTPNLVPSFGHPVSDNWYVLWDTISMIPQMSIGRLTAKNIEEFEHYFTKHQKYLADEYDQWNKSYLLLSGGLDEFSRNFSKNVNNKILSEIIHPSPIGGYNSFLYSTTNPPTNFGPFEVSYIDSVFSSGAVVISYIGHSGTRIWDNGIEDVVQLNNVVNKSSFITDFGCSTGKFAEPDIISFSEAHTKGLEGDAIGYIGNSSLGFTSTTSKFPSIFYSELLIGDNNLGNAFLSAKTKFLSKYGTTPVNDIFIYTNTLFADPIIKLNIPTKPNLNIETKDIYLPEFLDDNLDSIFISIKFRNLGRVDTNQFIILINDIFNGEIQYSKQINRILPLNSDEFEIAIPVKNLAGKHTLGIYLDATSKIDEIYESDNKIEISYDVLTSSIRVIKLSKFNNRFKKELKFLNSVQRNESESIILEIDESSEFLEPMKIKKRFDTLVTNIKYSNLKINKRYFLRTRLNNSDNYFETVSFINSDDSLSYYYVSDSISFERLKFSGISIEHNSLKLDKKNISLVLSSDGFNTGGVAKLQLDNVDYANNPQGCGHHILVFDDKNYEYIESKWFNMWSDPDFNNYVEFLDTLSSDKLIAISLSNFCGGGGVTDTLIQKLHEYGSTLIDSVTWNTSWIFFGKKGNLPGDNLEKYSNNGIVELDSIFVTENDFGWFETEYFPKGIELNSIHFSGNFNDSSIYIQPIILNLPDTVETLYVLNGVVSLANLNKFKDQKKKIRINFRKNEINLKPSIDEFSIELKLNAELSTNYQVVSIEQDSVEQGEDANLSFYVYNVGESTADSFKIKVEVNKPDNSREKVFEELVDSLGAEKRKQFNISYNTIKSNGTRTFSISIDTDNKIQELYEDNNFYTIPFYVKGDTTKPSMNITFDGNDIFEGEYISSIPKIKIEMSEPSPIPITDTTSVSIFLNNERVNYTGNEDVLSINYSQSNPKVVVDYTPQLEDGEYEIRVFGKDASGNVADSSGISKSFVVANDAKIMEVYNYPNPMTNETYFTFKLTQIPDEVKIRIFTIAGRLIKEIILNGIELNYDLNKIYWDGLDTDGDEIGNGVYIYKVIMDVDGDKQVETKKLAVVK